ncbi:MAG: hypothetical protein P1P86_06340 [Bacteroidales bacterium]|nr:hypothetical protein [Bacteroidales bacterium]
MKIAVLSRNDHLKCDIIMDDRGPSMFYKGEDLHDIDAVIPRIGASVTFYGTAVVRQFEMMKVFSAIDSLAITRSRDKLRSLQILSRRGPLILEVNSSPGLEGIEKSTGVDIAGKIVEFVELSIARQRRPKDRIRA